MTRDETVRRFLECETKRREAIAAGKDEDEDEAHAAAKACWNAWAAGLLADRKAMEAAGRWSAEPENDATRDWIARAKADFSFCLFLNKGAPDEGEAKAAWEKKTGEGKRLIPVEAQVTRLNGFLFPGDALFDAAKFAGPTSFMSAKFSEIVSFRQATFSGTVIFDGSTFSGDAWFDGASFNEDAFFGSGEIRDRVTFLGRASFENSTFSRTAWFEYARFHGIAFFNRANWLGVARFGYTIDPAR